MKQRRADINELAGKLDLIGERDIPENEAIEACLSALMGALGAERGFLFLRNIKSNDWRVFSHNGPAGDSLYGHDGVRKAFVDLVYKVNKPLISVNSSMNESHNAKQIMKASEHRSVLCVPLLAEEECHGVIYADIHFCVDFFTEKDRDYMVLAAGMLMDTLGRLFISPEKGIEALAAAGAT